MLLLSEGQAGEAWDPSWHGNDLSDIGSIGLKSGCKFCGVKVKVKG